MASIYLALVTHKEITAGPAIEMMGNRSKENTARFIKVGDAMDGRLKFGELTVNRELAMALARKVLAARNGLSSDGHANDQAGVKDVDLDAIVDEFLAQAGQPEAVAKSARYKAIENAARGLIESSDGVVRFRFGLKLATALAMPENFLQPVVAIDEEQRKFISDVARQTPEKPDYWNSCGQCARNIERAQELVDSDPKPEGGM